MIFVWWHIYFRSIAIHTEFREGAKKKKKRQKYGLLPNPLNNDGKNVEMVDNNDNEDTDTDNDNDNDGNDDGKSMLEMVQWRLR